ncbi:MAG: hypothetical protein EBU66_16925, partial [Bacteroidetes bacterium]|nr:hypothetical protein [Bacteroidota bacterium]
FLLHKKHNPPYISMKPFNDNYNAIDISFYTLLKNSNHVYFNRKNLEKKVATKLFAVKYLPCPINTIMNHYYVNNRSSLIL